uniref:Uncharacterized protein n=1 Tax=Romanomermis culicivorax TaxID=13658 RepID=A0A915JJK2_ROMCU
QINNGGYIIAQDATLAQNNETGTGAGSSAGLDLRCQAAVRPTPPPNNERDDVRRTNRLRVLMKQNNRKTANMIDQKCRIIFPSELDIISYTSVVNFDKSQEFTDRKWCDTR